MVSMLMGSSIAATGIAQEVPKIARYYITPPEPTPGQYPVAGPYIDSILIKLITSPDAAVIALEKGEVDAITHHLPPSTLTALATNPDIEVRPVEHVYQAGFYWNTWGIYNIGPEAASCPGSAYAVGDLQFRTAWKYAWGDAPFLEEIYGFKTDRSVGAIGKVFGDFYAFEPYGPYKGVKQDLNKAKEILDEAGYKDIDGDGWRETPTGLPINLKLVIFAEIPENAPLSLAFTHLGKQMEIKVTTFAMDSVSIWPMWFEAKGFDISAAEGEWMACWPEYPYYCYHSTRPPGICFTSGLPEQDAAIDKIWASMNREEAKKWAHEFQRLVYEDGNPLQYGYLAGITPYRTDRFVGWINSPSAPPYRNPWNYLNVRLANGEYGGQLVMAFGPPSTSNNNPWAWYEFYDQDVWGGGGFGLIWETLFRYHTPTDTAGPLVPCLAESYDSETLADGSEVVTVHLFRNIKWSDGVPFTAADVKYSLDKQLEFKQSPFAGQLLTSRLYKTEVVDDYTAKLYFKKAGMWNIYKASDAPILPEHIWKPMEEAGVKLPEYTLKDSDLVGTGPFKLKEWKRGEYILLEKNPLYRDLPKTVYEGNRWAPPK